MAKLLAVILLNITLLFGLSTYLSVEASNQTNVCTDIKGEVQVVRAMNRSCTQSFHRSVQSFLNITWNDGSYSLLTSDQTIDASGVTNVLKASGVGAVTSGRYLGNDASNWSTFTDTSFGCLSGVGLSQLTGVAFVSIGTAGQSQWIVCTGNATILYSPAVTSAAVAAESKLTINYDNCIGSCESKQVE